MKKLEKLTLKEMSLEFATIGFEEAQHLNGGYTVAEMDAMMSAGTWTGGDVDGMGYVGGVCTVGMSSQLSYGTVSTLNHTVGSSYSDVYKDAALSVGSGWFAPAAEVYALGKTADDLLKVKWDNVTKEAVDELLHTNGITIDSNISWSTENNTLKVWDQCGNLIYSF